MGFTFLFLGFSAIISPVFFVLSAKKRYYLLISLLSIVILSAFLDLYSPGNGSVTTITLGDGLGPLSIFFSIHPYSRIAAFGFALVGSLAILYGLEVAKPSEQVLSLWALASAMGVAFAGNFITLFIFWELLTLTTASLIMINRTPHSLRMGFRFLYFQLAGGLLLFLGIVQQYAATGSLALVVPEAGLAFFILGIGVKTAFIPLNMWLPWGYPAASFNSSVLLSALTTKVGVYALARILPPSSLIAFMGAAMAIYGVCFAIFQTDLRRLLSYHIISQVGFMVAGVGLGLSLSVDGGLLHLVNHMFYKALLFMSAGALIYVTGTGDLHELYRKHGNGDLPTWKALPYATIAAVAGALAIAGVPPFNGYVSKYLLKRAVAGVSPIEWMLFAAGVGTALSFSKFVYFGFIKSRAKIIRKLPVSMQAVMMVLAASLLILGIRPQLIGGLLPHGSYLTVYSLKGVFASLQPVAGGVLLFMILAGLLNPAHDHRQLAAPIWLAFPVTLVEVKNSINNVRAKVEVINNSQMIILMTIAFLLVVFYTFTFFTLTFTINNRLL
ncbi:MAG: hypothetical protein KGZ79_10995 [Dethiobacter sp.]|jgi:multicomponent Na+:H+ antiporter subunit D|nr:hypothetical protein [Dethiobacter sp.]